MQLTDHNFENLNGQLLTKVKVTKIEQSGNLNRSITPSAVVLKICWSLEPPGVLEKQLCLASTLSHSDLIGMDVS